MTNDPAQEKRYIGNTRPEEAKRTYLKSLELEPMTEIIPVTEGFGRVTSQAVFAELSSPSYNCAAMDGIAVIAESTREARPRNPVRLKENETFVFVNTGNPVDEPYDAVIMKEDVIHEEEGITIYSAAVPWQHVRPIGEDIVATEMILPKDHKIRSFDLGSLISGGLRELPVYRRPLVTILPTGSEIVTSPDNVKKGRIQDSNSYMLAALTQEAGGIPIRLSPVRDDYELLKDTIQKAADSSDLVLVGAGSSAGTKDFTARIVEELGEVVVHGIAIKPGKPSILGKINGTPVIGVPGYPVSSYISFMEFAHPVIMSLSGEKEKEVTVDAVINTDVHSSLKSREFLRVSLHFEDGVFRATPTRSGAGVSMSLVRSDGIGIIEREVEGLNRGETIKVRLLRPLEDVKNRLTITGSHDIAIDVLGNMMAVNSTHVGSMGGVLAMRRKEALLSPIHILDEKDGTYNINILKTYFPGDTHVIIRGPGRIQGLMVKKGNPDGIRDLEDLAGGGILFMNRQRGSGTRIFLDHKLKEKGIDPEKIAGYQREATTHTSVAAAVAQGSAQVGAGVYSAAVALGLDFIPLGQENYDFLAARKSLEDPRIQEFIRNLSSSHFKEELKKRGGYILEDLGKIIDGSAHEALK